MNAFRYKYIDNKAPRTLVLLHGTGGTEEDFLFQNEELHDSFNLLGLKGNIDENGLARFFKRKALGVFDQENIKEETGKLSLFINNWMKEYNMNIDQFVFMGYSNGANMILATLFYYPELIKNAVLLRPMVPFTPEQNINLADNTILFHYAPNDEMVVEEDSIKLIELLRSYKADVTFQTYSTGHQLSSEEMNDIFNYLQ